MTKPTATKLPTSTSKRTGFGNYRSAEQLIYRPERRDEVLMAPAELTGSSLLATGLGNSYGDAALNASGILASMARMDRMLSFDAERAILSAEAGVTVLDVMRTFVPQGLTLAATPGLSNISLGGCAAFDIHSKNHWLTGGFGASVLSMRVLLADGKVIMCSREKDSDLFFATIGGMGMTGIILDMELQLHRLAGLTASSQSLPFRGVSELLKLIIEAKEKSSTSHMVAWVDLLNRSDPGGYLIVSKLVAGATSNDIWKNKKAPPLGLIAPFFNRLSNKAFNLAFSLKHRFQPTAKTNLRSFLFPWDSMPNWNRLYGKKGFVEYQCCIPAGNAAESLTHLFAYVLRHKASFPAYFAAVKSIRAGDGMLSFPLDGYSILFDFPVSDGLWKFLDELDELIIAAGGRVYLAKDGRVSADAYQRMYPRLAEWQSIRRKYDPDNLFVSDMARRLNLVEINA